MLKPAVFYHWRFQSKVNEQWNLRRRLLCGLFLEPRGRDLGCCSTACGVGTVGRVRLLLACLWKFPQVYYLLLRLFSGCCTESIF